jgi:large subunit ribosomal protein L13
LPPQIGIVVLFKKINVVNTLSYRTISANSETADKQWVLVDAEGQTLGRLASKVAKMIRGKHKANFTPHVDCGDNVIVINAEKVLLSGTKMDTKEYIRYTGYPGGQRILTAKEIMEKHPERLIEKAVKGMLPKNRLGRTLYTNLKVYVGAEHKHEAQKPQVVNLDSIK